MLRTSGVDDAGERRISGVKRRTSEHNQVLHGQVEGSQAGESAHLPAVPPNPKKTKSAAGAPSPHVAPPRHKWPPPSGLLMTPNLPAAEHAPGLVPVMAQEVVKPVPINLFNAAVTPHFSGPMAPLQPSFPAAHAYTAWMQQQAFEAYQHQVAFHAAEAQTMLFLAFQQAARLLQGALIQSYMPPPPPAPFVGVPANFVVPRAPVPAMTFQFNGLPGNPNYGIVPPAPGMGVQANAGSTVTSTDAVFRDILPRL